MAWQKITINKEVVKRFTADELGNMYCIYSSVSGVVNGAGILKRLAGSQEWVDITPRGQIVDTWTNVEDIKYANGVLLVTIRSSQNFGNIIRSTDKGATWTRCPLIYDATEQRYDPFHLEYLGNSKWACSVISMEYSYYISVLRSDDNGLNWYSVRLDNIQGWSGATYGITKASNDSLYISTADSIYNSGINSYDSFQYKQAIPYPAIDIKDIDGELYLTLSSALFGYEKVVKTQYLGETAVDFSNFTITNNIETVYGIVKIAENTFICTTGNSTGDGDIWKTENNGTTWVKEEMGAQYEYFMYPYLYNNKVYVGSGKDAGDGDIWILSLDSEPPLFNSVSIDTITYNSANLNVNSNEDGIVYYKILARNAVAPTSEELKANPTGQANVVENTTSIIPLTGLTSNADLDCYVVAEDAVPNLQLTPTKIQFTTLSNQEAIVQMAWQKIEVNRESVRRFTHDELGNMYCTYSSASGVVNGAGILKRLADSEEWVDITPRGQIVDTWTNVEDIKYANGTLIITMPTSKKIIRSLDKGTNWTNCTISSGVYPTQLEYFEDNKWVCAMYEDWDYSKILKSSDNGATWGKTGNLYEALGKSNSITKASNGLLYIVTTSGILSSDFATFSSTGKIGADSEQIKDIDGELYVSKISASSGVITKTQYTGTSEVAFFPAIAGIEKVYGIVKIAENTFICSTGSSTGDGDIWKTENNGITWIKEEMGSQYEYFMYPYLYNNKVYVGSGKDAGDGAIWILSLDSEPPLFNSVSIDTITYNSANLNVNSNETGIVYYKVITRDATAPTSVELKASPTGQTNVTANTTSIIPLTGLVSNANLDCYVVAEDTVPNLQLEPTKIQFTTPPAPTGDIITSTDKSYKTSINSTSMRFVVKPNTKYTFGLQAIRTTKEGIIATNIIQNEVITTPNKSNFKGVVQVTDDANYLYQKTTLRLGQNAIGTNDDGLYVGNTAIEDNPTNFMKFSTTNGTFDLKSTGNIRFTNGSSNELFFDSGTTTNSFLKMNSGKQQLGLCTDSGGSYQGLFVGNTTLSNGEYFKYDGENLTVGKNVKFNWIDTLSIDATQSLQYLMNKTIDQMLKGTTTYTDNLITVRSGLGVGNEKAYFGNMSTISNGFGLKIDSDANNYFYANTVDGVKFKTNKNVNIKNTTNEINFDSTTSTNSFISMNGGSQQIGKVNLTIPAIYDKAIGSSGNNYITTNNVNLTSILKVGDNINIIQMGKVSTVNATITNISFLTNTTITVNVNILDTYTSANIIRNSFSGLYIGNSPYLSGNEMYIDSLGVNFSGKYFNKTAYCDTSLEFLGALDTSKSTINNVLNPFYNKNVNEIILTGKDEWIHQDEFINYATADITTVDIYIDLPQTFSTDIFYVDTQGIYYVQNGYGGTFTYVEMDYSLFSYINPLGLGIFPRDENMTVKFMSNFSGQLDNTIPYYLVPYDTLGRLFYISKEPLGAIETLTVGGSGVHFGLQPAYNINSTYAMDSITIGSHFGANNYVIPISNIYNISSLSKRESCTIDMNNSGFILNYPIIINEVGIKNIGSDTNYNGVKYSIYAQGKNINLTNMNFTNVIKPISLRGVKNSAENIDILNIHSDITNLFKDSWNLKNVWVNINKVYSSLSGGMFEGGGLFNTVIFFNPNSNDVKNIIMPSNASIFSNCRQLDNIEFYEHIYDRLFFNCTLIKSSLYILPSSAFTFTTTKYMIDNCTHITNFIFQNLTSLVGFTKAIKDSGYIMGVEGATSSQQTGLSKDVNNSWN